MISQQKMKAFINALFEEYYPDCGDIDGGTLQDLAEKHEILVPEIRHEPCGEFCNCAQVCSDEDFQEGVKCYHLASWLSSVTTPYTRPEVTEADKAQAKKNAEALVKKNGFGNLGKMLAILVLENIMLMKEINEYRAARGIEPLKVYEA